MKRKNSCVDKTALFISSWMRPFSSWDHKASAQHKMQPGKPLRKSSETGGSSWEQRFSELHAGIWSLCTVWKPMMKNTPYSSTAKQWTVDTALLMVSGTVYTRATTPQLQSWFLFWRPESILHKAGTVGWSGAASRISKQSLLLPCTET